MERLRVRNDRVTWREVDGEVVGLDLQASTYFSANATGTLLWPLLVEGTTTGELSGRLVERFQITPEQADSDVETYVTSLRDLGFLES